MRYGIRGPAVLATVLALTSCASGATTARAAAPPSRPATFTDAAPPSTDAAGRPPTGRVSKVLTIVLENHGTAAAMSGMPKLARLARTYGYTTHYRALTHPSLPNYLALAGGSTFGVHDDKPPAAHPIAGASVFDQALAGGKTAVTYAEAMPGNCAATSTGRYAVKHNPWAYFNDASARRNCAAHDVPAGTTSAGALHNAIVAGALPVVGLLVPDLCHDAHDCPLATADSWVAGWLAQLQQGPDWLAGRLAIVVTFDEAENGGDNTVLTVVAAPGVAAKVSAQPLTHLSWTRWMSALSGSAAPGQAKDALSLGAAFGL